MNGAVLLLCVAVILFFAVMLALSAIKIVPEYERGVVFRLGRLVGARGPGLFFLIPVAVDVGFLDVHQALEQLVAQHADALVLGRHFLARQAEALAHADDLVRRQRSAPVPVARRAVQLD